MSDVINRFSVNGEVYDLADEEARLKISEFEKNLIQEVANAVNDYLTKNPVEGEVSQEDIEQAVLDYMSVNSEKFVGATPQFEVGTIETLDSGSSVTVDITGTAENPILNLGIPRGRNGENGVSPTIDVIETESGYTVTITDVNGEKPAFEILNGVDGISPTVSMSKDGSVTTITITDKDGEHKAEIKDGASGSGGESTPVEVNGETVTIPSSSSSSSGGSTYKDPLDGKKILCIGDSICEGVGASGKPYPYWIQQWHETATVYNLGVGGMTIAQKDESITNSMPVRIASGEFENEDYADPDIIVFEGGINDFMNNVKHGYIQKSYNVSKYVTFCQGMEYMFNYFKTLFPKARMIFCSTHNLTSYDFNKAQSWWGATSEICTKWGVEFLDLFALICTEKVDGLQLHPSGDVHRDYYAQFINRALVSETPLSGAQTTNYYAMNPACTIYFHSGTKSFEKGSSISTSDWRVNMIRCDGTTYENVTSKVTYDLSDVDNTTEGTYPVHIAYSENGINIAIDVTITITGESTEKTLESISATKTNTSYNVGSEVNTDDITVTATYSDGSTSDVTSNSTIDTSNINNTTAGEYNIAVSYTENEVTKTTAIQITIVQGGATTVVASGTAIDKNNRETITWSLDSDGVINFDTTSNNVTIGTYNQGSQPWYSYMSQIKKAVFNSRIIGIGGNALSGATSLTNVELQSESVTIGASAFKGCTALTNIDLTKANSILNNGLANCTTLPSEIVLGPTSLGTNAFYYQNQITSIRFTGTPASIATDALSSITGWGSSANLTDIYVPWSEGDVANAPWGASSATIHYNYTE